MKCSTNFLVLLFSLAPTGWSQSIEPKQHPTQTPSFEDKLKKRIPQFDTAGRTPLACLLDLAFEYQLPVGLEYLDRQIRGRPIDLRIGDRSVREVLMAVIEEAPGYHVSFSEGLVDVYSTNAREDSSNLLNRVIKRFDIERMDTHEADSQLLCLLAGDVEPRRPCGGSIAVGQWGPAKINIHMNNAKVYEIL